MYPEFDTWGFNLSLKERLDYWFSVRLTGVIETIVCSELARDSIINA